MADIAKGKGRGMIALAEHASSVLLAQIEEFVRSLVVAGKAVVFYPPASHTPLETAKAPAELLHHLLEEQPDLTLEVGRGGYLFYDKKPLLDRTGYGRFAEDLFDRHVLEVRFHAGVEARDIVLFLNALRYSPEELEAAGGWEGHLWEQGVATITLHVAHSSVADLPTPATCTPFEQQVSLPEGEEAKPAKALELVDWVLPQFAETRDYSLLVQAAAALRAAETQADVSPEQLLALRLGDNRLAAAIDVREFTTRLRPRIPGDKRYDTANALLHTFGPSMVRLLLDALANETDMATRKTLVDILSEIACEQFAELVTYLDDTRWYVVRNVVSVLSATKSLDAIPYLDKVLVHPDPRVRREAIRALSRIPDRTAQERLIRCLRDDDAQNVQLAARYLGLAKVRTAIPMLEQVARGEGQGCRDTGPRVEAIESLARMQATEAKATLESICKMPLFGRSKSKEVATAARAACELLQRTAK